MILYSGKTKFWYTVFAPKLSYDHDGFTCTISKKFHFIPDSTFFPTPFIYLWETIVHDHMHIYSCRHLIYKIIPDTWVSVSWDFDDNPIAAITESKVVWLAAFWTQLSSRVSTWSLGIGVWSNDVLSFVHLLRALLIAILPDFHAFMHEDNTLTITSVVSPVDGWCDDAHACPPRYLGDLVFVKRIGRDAFLAWQLVEPWK